MPDVGFATALALTLMSVGCGGATTPQNLGPDAAAATPDAAAGCPLPSGSVCATGASCQTATCDAGTAVSCACASSGRLLCTGACAAAGGDTDGGPGDGGAGDAGGGASDCVLPDGTTAPAGGATQIGWCPGGAPLLCYCGADLTIVCPSVCA